MFRFWVAVALVASASSAALAQSIFSTGFESADGYGSAGPVLLSDHGWISDSRWLVPEARDNFAHGGARSALCGPVHTMQERAIHWASFTPASGADVVVYSVWVALQSSPGNSASSTATGLEMSYGSPFAGMSIDGKGTVSCFTTSGGSGPFFHSLELDVWHQMSIRADFGDQTASFSIDGDLILAQGFSSDGLDSVALVNEIGNPADSGMTCRYDDVEVDAVPEPAPVQALAAMLFLFFAIRFRREC